MNTDLQQIGAVLASHVDMAKGFLGDRFAVSIVARDTQGPFHLLLGDDGELALIGCLSELQRTGRAMIRNGEAQDTDPSMADHMLNLLRELVEESAHWADDRLAEFRQRAAVVVDTLEERPHSLTIEPVQPGDDFVPIADLGPITTHDVTGGGVNDALAPRRPE